MKKGELKEKIKKNKKKLIFAGVVAGGVGAYFGYNAIKSYGLKQKAIGIDEATKAAYDISYQKLKGDVIENFLNTKLMDIEHGAKITLYNDKFNKKIFLVGEDQQLDFVNSCINHVPEIKAHMQLRFGNPAAEVKTI